MIWNRDYYFDIAATSSAVPGHDIIEKLEVLARYRQQNLVRCLVLFHRTELLQSCYVNLMMKIVATQRRYKDMHTQE